MIFYIQYLQSQTQKDYVFAMYFKVESQILNALYLIIHLSSIHIVFLHKDDTQNL